MPVASCFPDLQGLRINVGPFSVACRMWVMCAAFCCLQHRPASVIAFSDKRGLHHPDSDTSVAAAFAGDFKSQKLHECILAFSALSTATMSLFLAVQCRVFSLGRRWCVAFARKRWTHFAESDVLGLWRFLPTMPRTLASLARTSRVCFGTSKVRMLLLLHNFQH